MLNAQPLPCELPTLERASDRTRAIVATLLYYDLFAFSPSAEELVRFAHRGGRDGHFAIGDLEPESAWWSSQQGYWYLKGRQDLLARRPTLGSASHRKLEQARRWARRLQLVPGVRFIGVTGSLSMASAVSEDDIDILIIAAPGRLWTARALVLGLLWAARVKRPDDGRMEHPDQVCANIFLSEDNLTIPDRNLFIAHEICQMLPLLGPATYLRFVAANNWVCEYLPQWEPRPGEWQDRRELRLMQRGLELALAGPVGARLEHELMRRQLDRIQAKHARGHNAGVKLSSTQLRFHPRDLSNYILSAFDAHWNALAGSAQRAGAEE